MTILNVFLFPWHFIGLLSCFFWENYNILNALLNFCFSSLFVWSQNSLVKIWRQKSAHIRGEQGKACGACPLELSSTGTWKKEAGGTVLIMPNIQKNDSSYPDSKLFQAGCFCKGMFTLAHIKRRDSTNLSKWVFVHLKNAGRTPRETKRKTWLL